MFRKIKINFKREKNMTLLNKIITRYMLIATVILSSGYIVKLHGAECFPEVVKTNGVKDFLALQWGLSAREGRRSNFRGPELSCMEDRCTVYLNGNGLSFFGVYDGHGGTNAAGYAKEHLHKNFFKAQDETTGERLEYAFLKTDEDFLADSQFKKDYSGTTAVVAVIDANEKKLYIANAGDSRAMLIRNGKVLLATEDREPKDEEKKRIKSAGGRVSGGKIWSLLENSVLLNTIGNRHFKKDGKVIMLKPDIYEENMENGDILILASDGVWDIMKAGKAAKFVRKKFDENKIDEEDLTEKQILKEGAEREEEVKYEESNNEQAKLVARALCNEAYERGSTDNISVLIVKVVSLLRAGADELLKGKEKKI